MGIMWINVDEFQEEVMALAEWDITNQQFEALVNELKPIPEPKITEKGISNQRAITNAEVVQSELKWLYNTDSRCAPWNGTALGAFQAFNTHAHHFTGIRRSKGEDGQLVAIDRMERNYEMAISGKGMTRDLMTVETLANICDVRNDDKLKGVFAWN
jgi:hypothetical protein